MKTIRLASCAIAVITGMGLSSSARAEGRFYFPVGISYASGIHDATDKLYDFYKQDGYTDVTKIDIPVGLVLNPYYEWLTSIGGIGAGVTVGPTMFLVVDEKTDYYGFGESSSSDNVKFSYVVPVGAFVRYTPWPKATFAPYVRAGVKYPFAGGDNLESSSVGGFGAVGVELWRTKKVGMSLEVGYRFVSNQSQIHRHRGVGQSTYNWEYLFRQSDLPGLHRRLVGCFLIRPVFVCRCGSYPPPRIPPSRRGFLLPDTGFPQNCCHTGRTRQ